jgi:hypothetical protein
MMAVTRSDAGVFAGVSHAFRLVAWGAAVAVLALTLPVLTTAGRRPVGAATSTKTVWLCNPNQGVDPCAYSRATTSLSATGAATVLPTPAPTSSASKFDCFYVYPTVSTQTTENANLTIQPAEIGAAVDQASRFSQVCRVWAPMYRQVTTAALFKGAHQGAAGNLVAYQSLLAGWKDYLAHDNDGRPVIFIGHSQGSAMLIRLLHNEIDPSARLRKLMVSALIMGGNVQVPIGKTVGGSFHHIPICTSSTQSGCVIAYSTFPSTPPLASIFGRPGQGVSLQSGQTAKLGQQVACVNPVNFSSAPGSLQPYFLRATQQLTGVSVATPWVTYPNLYTASCQRADGATWLQITPASVQGDPRPLVTEALGPLWGYHLNDVNLALGNLVSDVASEEAAHR